MAIHHSSFDDVPSHSPLPAKSIFHSGGPAITVLFLAIVASSSDSLPGGYSSACSLTSWVTFLSYSSRRSYESGCALSAAHHPCNTTLCGQSRKELLCSFPVEDGDQIFSMDNVCQIF